jgi:hypothetical protein
MVSVSRFAHPSPCPTSFSSCSRVVSSSFLELNRSRRPEPRCSTRPANVRLWGVVSFVSWTTNAFHGGNAGPVGGGSVTARAPRRSPAPPRDCFASVMHPPDSMSGVRSTVETRKYCRKFWPMGCWQRRGNDRGCDRASIRYRWIGERALEDDSPRRRRMWSPDTGRGRPRFRFASPHVSVQGASLRERLRPCVVCMASSSATETTITTDPLGPRLGNFYESYSFGPR